MSKVSILCSALVAAFAAAALANDAWIDVPFVRQTENTCGAAVISMVMQYWASEMESSDRLMSDPIAIVSELYSETAKGIYASEVERYFREHGFQTFAFAGRWSDLEKHITRGRPLIASLAPFGKKGRLHYVVVAGINNNEEIVLLNDPAERKLVKMKRSQFEKLWEPTNDWTLLVLPNQRN